MEKVTEDALGRGQQEDPSPPPLTDPSRGFQVGAHVLDPVGLADATNDRFSLPKNWGTGPVWLEVGRHGCTPAREAAAWKRAWIAHMLRPEGAPPEGRDAGGSPDQPIRSNMASCQQDLLEYADALAWAQAEFLTVEEAESVAEFLATEYGRWLGRIEAIDRSADYPDVWPQADAAGGLWLLNKEPGYRLPFRAPHPSGHPGNGRRQTTSRSGIPGLPQARERDGTTRTGSRCSTDTGPGALWRK
jgi:hypothetical protein